MIQVGCTYLMSSSEWADEWVMSLGLKILNTKESKIHHPLIGPLTTCSEGYESFDLSKTHSLSTQDLIKNFIDWFITMTVGKAFQIMSLNLF